MCVCCCAVSPGSVPLKSIELPLEPGSCQLHSLCAPSIPDPAVVEGSGTFELPPPQVGRDSSGVMLQAPGGSWLPGGWTVGPLVVFHASCLCPCIVLNASTP